MKPPIARADNYGSLPLFVEACGNWSATLHALVQELIKTFAGASLSKIFVPHGYDIDGIKFYRDVERFSGCIGGPSQYYLESCLRIRS